MRATVTLAVTAAGTWLRDAAAVLKPYDRAGFAAHDHARAAAAMAGSVYRTAAPNRSTLSPLMRERAMTR